MRSFALVLVATSAFASPCPPLSWNPEHPGDCRNTATNATVLGTCCDRLSRFTDRVEPKQCLVAFSYIAATNTCTAPDPVCCHPELWPARR